MSRQVILLRRNKKRKTIRNRKYKLKTHSPRELLESTNSARLRMSLGMWQQRNTATMKNKITEKLSSELSLSPLGVFLLNKNISWIFINV